MAVWDPFLEMERLRREFDRAMGETGGRPLGQRSAFLPGRAARQYPLVNVHDDGESYHIEALAPGLDPSQLDVSVVRNVVTISGEKPGLLNVAPERVHRSERSAGKFVRNVQLPADVDAAQVEAEYRNGLLHITLPRAETARPRRVEIRSQ
jgi:HSP20 family protein